MTALLEIDALKVQLRTGRQPVRAVDGLSLAIQPGETFALLGESGCGKSMTALSVMRLLPETGEVTQGSIRLNGEELLSLPESAMRKVRGNRVGMIFQEPMLSLNPVMTTGEQIEEVLSQHSGLRGRQHKRAFWSCCTRWVFQIRRGVSKNIRSSSRVA